MDTVDFILICKSIKAIPFQSKWDKVRLKNGKGNFREQPSCFKLFLRRLLTSYDNQEYTDESSIIKLKSALIYRKIFFEDKESQQAIDILTALSHYLGTEITRYKPLDNKNWKIVIGLVKGYIQFNPSSIITLGPDKDEEKAKAAVRLRDIYKLKITLKENAFLFSDEGEPYKSINIRVADIGGAKFLQYVLSHLNFDKKFERFIIPNKTTTSYVREAKPSEWIPYNYCLNSAIKNIGKSGNKIFDNFTYKKGTLELIKLALFVDYNVQPYLIWDDIFFKGKNFIEYLKDIIFRESIFGLFQSGTSYIKDFLTYLTNDPEIVSLDSKNKIKDFVKLAIYFLELSSPYEVLYLNKKVIKLKKFSKDNIIKILDSIIKPVEAYNSDFLYPQDYESVNYRDCPIIGLDKDTILLLPSSIQARCWCEAFFTLLRQFDDKIDGKLGHIMERYISNLFKIHGIEMKNVNYHYDKKHIFECDGLIEGTKSIMLFELKKKALIRKSQAGNEAYILSDLGKSLIDSQYQLFRTKGALYNGAKFYCKKNLISIPFKAKKISLFSLIPFPFGEIQSRIITEICLEKISKSKFSIIEYKNDEATEKKLQGDLDSIRRKFDEIIKDFKKFPQSKKNDKTGKPFFDSWFIDFEQLWILLDGINNVSTFEKRISKINYVTFGLSDFLATCYILNLFDIK